MVGAAKNAASLAMHLTSGVYALKRVCERMVETLSTIAQCQYGFSCITRNV